jgi:hypothetical protein
MPILLPEDDEALLAQCDFEAFRASGKGGQHINKTDSAVRLHHRPTGITVTSQESRSQWQNRFLCLQKIREKVAAALGEKAEPVVARVGLIRSFTWRLRNHGKYCSTTVPIKLRVKKMWNVLGRACSVVVPLYCCTALQPPHHRVRRHTEILVQRDGGLFKGPGHG